MESLGSGTLVLIKENSRSQKRSVEGGGCRGVPSAPPRQGWSPRMLGVRFIGRVLNAEAAIEWV